MKLPFDREEPIVVSRTYRPSTRILALTFLTPTAPSRSLPRGFIIPAENCVSHFPYTWLNIVVPYRMENRFLLYVPNIPFLAPFLVTSRLSSFKHDISMLVQVFYTEYSPYCARGVCYNIFKMSIEISNEWTFSQVQFSRWEYRILRVTAFFYISIKTFLNHQVEILESSERSKWRISKFFRLRVSWIV